MRKAKRNNQGNPEPYEDMLRLEKLDAYESLIEFNVFDKQNNKSIEE